MSPTFLTWRLQGLQNLSSGLQGLHRPHLSNSGEEIREPQLAATAEQTKQAAAPPKASTFSFWPLSESQPTLSKLVSIDSSQMGEAFCFTTPTAQWEEGEGESNNHTNAQQWETCKEEACGAKREL